ncbi:hypothetical protein [uncultured phage cr130_1]|uniref:Uncharacterized protein n=1 Tax=uncultured phage cr130_1 TaxID=2772092 RepID=A0A7M1RTI1_9CAUD|nr:hypothetical protein KNV59_gp67 [uncultured phage cr130_1]QOR57638.1 hypothetical protein [uncultured phage cr130_1]
MRHIDILSAFEREINKIDDVIDKPITDDSIYWLNQAVYKFVKLRFNGSSPSVTSYELTEKRTADLINLYSLVKIDTFDIDDTNPGYDKYNILYHGDQFTDKPFLFALNEDVIISDNSNEHEKATCVFECTADNFMYRVNNILTDFHYRHYKARPLRIKTDNGCSLLTDKNYKIKEYTLGYLRKPKEISMENPLDEYVEFSDVILPEIIKMAAQMYIENKIPEQQRYQTIVNEVNTQE